MNTRITLMINADNLLVRAGLNAAFAKEKDVELIPWTSEETDDLFLRISHHRPKVLLLAVTIPDAQTLRLIEQVKAGLEGTFVCVISLCRDERFATACLGAGATGLINTSHDPDDLADVIRKVAKGEKFIHTKRDNNGALALTGTLSAENIDTAPPCQS